MKIYVASRLENMELVSRVCAKLEDLGHTITYNWAEHGPAYVLGRHVLEQVAHDEIEGVTSAKLVVVLLPGGRGTHAELGAALACGTPVLLFSTCASKPIHSWKGTCAFYYHPCVKAHIVCVDATLIAETVNEYIQNHGKTLAQLAAEKADRNA